MSADGVKPEDGYDAVIPTMLENLSPVLMGIVVILVLSASMSTLSSLVLTSSSVLTIDFIDPVFCSQKSLTEKKKVLLMRVFIVFFITVSAVIAIIQVNSPVMFISQMMGVSWGALAGAFLVFRLLRLSVISAVSSSIMLFWNISSHLSMQVCSLCFLVSLLLRLLHL